MLIPKGHIHPPCNSNGCTPEYVWHNNHSATTHTTFSHMISAISEGLFPFSSKGMHGDKQIPAVCTDLQISRRCYQPLCPHGCLFVVGWAYFVFNITLDCSTLSLGNIRTHFCTTSTAKPVSIFFLYISPSGTFTLTQNESLASQSFLATCSFEKRYNSHFREGLMCSSTAK